MTKVILARGLARWYGQVIGVNDLDVEVRPGITGLLGPNGAGKSTFMKLVTGQLRPSRGELSVLGRVPFANRRLYQHLGWVPEHDALYDELSGIDHVSFLLELHGLKRLLARESAEAALVEVGLGAALDRRVGGYSKGMRQRLKLAQAIAHCPELLIADEPFSGLDPIVRLQMAALFRKLASEGMHILISTHILHEVQALTDEVILIHRGRVIASGTIGEIRRLLHRHPRRVRLRAREPRRLARLLLEANDVVAVRLEGEGDVLTVETRDIDAFQQRLPALVAAAAPGIFGLESIDAGLEALFDYLVG